MMSVCLADYLSACLSPLPEPRAMLSPQSRKPMDSFQGLSVG